MTTDIFVGSSANDHSGDLLRNAFIKVNANFAAQQVDYEAKIAVAKTDVEGQIASLQAELDAVIASFNYKGDWLTGTVYSATLRDYVKQGGLYYLATVSHTAGTFATDLAALKWVQLDATALFAALAGTATGQGSAMVGHLPEGASATATTVNDELHKLHLESLDHWQKTREIELIAHRGFVSEYPENSLLALSMALARGATSLECDVQPSSDGVLYLFHDTTVDALTNGTGTFKALSAAYIDTLYHDSGTLPASTVAGKIGITKFVDFLEFAREQGVKIYPEIKDINTTADIDAMVQAVVDADMQHRCMFQCFYQPHLAYVRTLNSIVELGYLGSSASYATPVADMAALGRSSLLWSYSTVLANPAIVDYCYARGVGLGVWTVDTEWEANQLMKIGVSKIMSNISLGSMKAEPTPGLNLAVGDAWESWVNFVSGDGVITFSGVGNKIVNISSGVGTGSAKLDRRFYTTPGEVYEMSFIARRVSGTAGAAGSAWVDWPGVSGLKNRVEITSPYHREYKIRFAIPFTSVADSYISLGVGVYTVLGGQIEIIGVPKIKVDHTPHGVLRTIANGLIYWDGTTAALNASFSSVGIKSLTYNAGTKKIEIEIAKINTPVATRPIFFSQLTADGTATARKLTLTLGSYNSATGIVYAEFIDPATGLIVDIGSATYARYFFFKAEM
jgi:glycerophosphoryl diester phosphodiesterase